MHRNRTRTAGVPIALAGLVLAGCQDDRTLTSPDLAGPSFVQGVNGVWTVTTLDDSPIGDADCTDLYCTLRQALGNATDGDQIVFVISLNGDIPLVEPLPIPSSVTIDGKGRITLNGFLGFLERERVLSIASDKEVHLIGLTITGGCYLFGHAACLHDGGGIYNDGALTLTNSVVVQNGGIKGGGIFNAPLRTLTLVNSTLEFNRSEQDGAGIYNDRGTVTVLNSSIIANLTESGGLGGGIYTSSGDGDVGKVAMLGSTLSWNAAHKGGGIYSFGGEVGVQSSTFTRNASGNVGGIEEVIILPGAPSGVTIANSIIAGNVGGVSNECDAGFSSGGYNLTSDNGGCTFNEPTDLSVPHASVHTDVLEIDQADNGGPTETHALIENGPAVDAGSCMGESTDQRGFPRPIDNPLVPDVADGCDIGAYERAAPVLPPPPLPQSDLLTSLGVDKTNVKQGELLTYTIRVRNLGPETAPNVIVRNTMSSGVTFVDVSANKGTFTGPPVGETGVVTWTVGDMLNGDEEVAELVVTVLVRGMTTITNSAAASSDGEELDEANNSAEITVTVAPGGSGGGGGKGKKK